MAFVSVTRLRIRSWRFMPGFFFHAMRSGAQVKRAPGLLSETVFPDHERAFWTLTVWQDEASMRGFMLSGAHRQAMPKLIQWCDEASVVHWTQPETVPPSWAEADRRMRSEGRASKVLHPSPAHAGLSYRTPKGV